MRESKLELGGLENEIVRLGKQVLGTVDKNSILYNNTFSDGMLKSRWFCELEEFLQQKNLHRYLITTSSLARNGNITVVLCIYSADTYQEPVLYLLGAMENTMQ